MSKATCLVIQGFGEKTDLRTGRTLNLDASYEMFREAVQEAGLACYRADDLISKTIDTPLYEWLIRADLVIADVSTYNVNTVYQLGVRHALRRNRTIVVADSDCRTPFALIDLPVHTYTHQGRDIGRAEAQRFKSKLIAEIRKVMGQDVVDSPVYAFLPLKPPHYLPAPVATVSATVAAAPAAPNKEEQSAKNLLDSGRRAIDHISFWAAKMYFRALHDLRPNDESIVQHLAVVTYRSRLPDRRSSLEQAQHLLTKLNPRVTNNPDTLTLWGSVHRRRWELLADRASLDEAVTAFQRAFHARHDHATACDAAYLCDVRAREHARAGLRAEAIADAVMARRFRRWAMRLGSRALEAEPARPSDKYWVLASMWEAATGLEDHASMERLRLEAEAAAQGAWRLAVTRKRLRRLGACLGPSPLRANPEAPSETRGETPAPAPVGSVPEAEL